MTTKYEEQYYNDVHRIANALERIAEHYQKGSFALSIDGFNQCEMPLQNKEMITCPRCSSNAISIMYVTSFACDCKATHYTCLNCHKEFDV